MNSSIDIQHASTTKAPISDEILMQWIQLVLPAALAHAELTLRLVDISEMTTLNQTYRQQNKATNVLAFPSNLPDDIQLDQPFLGDVVICPDVLSSEQHDLSVPLIAHWAHIVIHGVLHLLGYDHQGVSDTLDMQRLEIEALAQLGFHNPYTSTGEESHE